jgi:hypothetical protein
MYKDRTNAGPKNIAATAATLLANLGMAEVEDNPVGALK